jgi:hypothetical protein
LNPDGGETAQARTYLSRVQQRLETEGFAIGCESWDPLREFDLVAKRSLVEPTQFGRVLSVFVFSRFERLSMPELRSFSAAAFAASQATVALQRGVGVAMFGQVIQCFPVALVPELQPDVRASMIRAKPRQHWFAAEFPVVVELRPGKVTYSERTPLVGMLYYRGYRQLADEILQP